MAKERGFWKKKHRAGQVWYTRHPVSRRIISTGCRDLVAAKAYRARLEREAADPTHAPEDPATFRLDLVVRHAIANRERAGKAEATLKIYRCKLGHWLRIVGDD